MKTIKMTNSSPATLFETLRFCQVTVDDRELHLLDRIACSYTPRRAREERDALALSIQHQLGTCEARASAIADVLATDLRIENFSRAKQGSHRVRR